jgi:hypothetical protein
MTNELRWLVPEPALIEALGQTVEMLQHILPFCPALKDCYEILSRVRETVLGNRGSGIQRLQEQYGGLQFARNSCTV